MVAFHIDLEDINLDTTPKEVTHPGRVVRRSENVCWSEIRKEYVLGKRIQLEDGTWVSEDYTLRDLATKHNVSFNYLKHKSADEGWKKLRKAYLARVDKNNIGQELGLYTTENYQAEVSALNACNKLGIVLEKYISHKFSRILEASEDVQSDGRDIDEELDEQFNAVNRTTGTPTFITDIQHTVKVANEIYSLQRKIYENSPRTDLNEIEQLTKKPKFRNEHERLAKLQGLQAKLASILKPNEVVETVAVSEIAMSEVEEEDE